MTAQRKRADESDGGDAPLARARHLYAERRERAAALGCGDAIFGEPGWDLLLHLFIAHREGTPVSLAEARIAAAASDTVALRSIALLENERLVARTPDPARAGHYRVALTRKAVDSMAELLSLHA